MKFNLALAALCATALGAAMPTFSHPDRIRFDGHCFTIEGKDTFLFSGSFHYFRCPKPLWRERFKLIKAAGFNAVDTYVPWNYSERKPPKGVSDFSQIDLKDLDAWMTMAENEFGLYTIVRPGPYICSEWATGGLPNWLQLFKPKAPLRPFWYRSDDPIFEEWSRHWIKAVAKVVRNHQLTRKPKGQKGMILWQVENEYDYAAQPEDAKRAYLRDLISTSKQSGIEVPIFTCMTDQVRHPNGDPVLSQAFDNTNQYNGWDIEKVIGGLRDLHTAQPSSPKMVTEFQGGWFSEVGGKAAEEQDGLGAVTTRSHTLLAMANGMTALNYYPLFGGTNFSDWASERITSSYDLFSPIREWGGTGPKYRAIQAIGRMLKTYGPDLARSKQIPWPVKASKQVRIFAREGKSGATYLFVWNPSRKNAASKYALWAARGGDLAPFAMNVFRYDDGLADGKWLIREAKPQREHLPSAVVLTEAAFSAGTPIGWKPVKGRSATTTDLKVWDSRFLFFRLHSPAGNKLVWVQPSGGEIVAAGLGSSSARQRGSIWKTNGSATVAALINPGWPKIGIFMERSRGIAKALLLNKLPAGQTLTAWQTRAANGPEDRRWVGPDVDTSHWGRDASSGQFPENSTVVARAEFTFKGMPSLDTRLLTDGVDDQGWFFVNGHLVGKVMQWGRTAEFSVGRYLRPGKNVVAVMIRNYSGPGGFLGPVSIEEPLTGGVAPKMDWTDRYSFSPATSYVLKAMQIKRNEHPHLTGPRPSGPALLTRSALTFDRPAWSGPWEVLLEGGGDGFVSFNGHPLGRYWEVGPQRGFYLPECWMKDRNVVEVTVVPGHLGDRIRAAKLNPLPMN